MSTGSKWFKTLWCGLALTVWIAVQGLALAQEQHGEKHEEGEHISEATIPDRPNQIVAEILAQDLLIQHFMATDVLTQIHQPASRARDLAKALEGKTEGLAPEDQTKLAAAIRRIVSTAKELDEYGDAKDAIKTKIVYRSFEGAVKSIRSLYPGVTPSHYWTCTMHPDVWKAAAGQCPKCGMKLLAKDHEGHVQEGEHHGEHAH